MHKKQRRKTLEIITGRLILISSLNSYLLLTPQKLPQYIIIIVTFQEHISTAENVLTDIHKCGKRTKFYSIKCSLDFLSL